MIIVPPHPVLFEYSRLPRWVGSEVLVSIVVTSCEDALHICESLGSVAEQTHRRIDLVVVDDLSTDLSVPIAREWLQAHQERFERALLIQHAGKLGLARARDTGIAAALANSAFVLEARNTVYPRAVARLLESLEDLRVGAAYSQTEIFGSERRVGHADVWDPTATAPESHIDSMALIFKAAWARIGGYNAGTGESGLGSRFAEHGIDAVFVPEILCRRRS